MKNYEDMFFQHLEIAERIYQEKERTGVETLHREDVHLDFLRIVRICALYAKLAFHVNVGEVTSANVRDMYFKLKDVANDH